MQVGTQELDALNVVLLVELLVDGVGTVGGATHGKEKDVLASGLLEGQGDGDGTTLASEVGLHTPDTLGGLGGGSKVPVVGAGLPPLAAVLGVHLHVVLGAELLEHLVDVVVDALVGLFNVHVGHGTDRELANDLGGDDRLGSGGGEGTLDTVDGQGREAPAGHEGRLLVLEDGGLAAERLVERLHGEGNVVVQALLLGGHGGDLLGDALDLDLAVSVDERAEDADKIGHGLLGGTAKDTRVEIGTGARNLDAVVVAATETVGQARALGAEPVVVADAHGVGIGKVLLALGHDELLQTVRAVLLHALEAHEEVDGELDTGGLVSLDGVEPAQDGPLVVSGTAAQHAAVLLDGKLKGLGLPAVALLGGLDVVVTVDEDGALALVVAVAGEDDGREVEVGALLLAERTELNGGAEVGQLVGEPLAHADDIRAAGSLGRDGGDGDGLAQALDEVAGQGVHLLEVAVELGGHFASLVGADRLGEVCLGEGGGGRRARKDEWFCLVSDRPADLDQLGRSPTKRAGHCRGGWRRDCFLVGKSCRANKPPAILGELQWTLTNKKEGSLVGV